MKLFNYRVLLKPEPEGGYTVSVPALPGCITYGANIEETKKMASEAIELYLERLISHNEAIPKEEDVLKNIQTVKADAYIGELII
jgi:predicted RNase H-like HicB family nuclease